MTSQQSLFATDSEPTSAPERRNKCFVKATDVESLPAFDPETGELLEEGDNAWQRESMGRL